MDCLASTQWRQKWHILHAFSIYRFKLKTLNAKHQNFNAKTLTTVKTTFEALPDIATTAVTDRRC